MLFLTKGQVAFDFFLLHLAQDRLNIFHILLPIFHTQDQLSIFFYSGHVIDQDRHNV